MRFNVVSPGLRIRLIEIVVSIGLHQFPVTGAVYPTGYKGNKIDPLDGKSFWPLVQGEKQTFNRPFYFQHQGNLAVRSGNWKLVKQYNHDWELYNLENDPVEMTDRSETDSLKRHQLTEQYQIWSKEYGVLPWPFNSKTD